MNEHNLCVLLKTFGTAGVVQHNLAFILSINIPLPMQKWNRNSSQLPSSQAAIFLEAVELLRQIIAGRRGSELGVGVSLCLDHGKVSQSILTPSQSTTPRWETGAHRGLRRDGLLP